MRCIWSGKAIFATSDLFFHPTITTWLCGCHLRCPFCHNWRIAEWGDCKEARPKKIVEEIVKAKAKVGVEVDYVHFTGGEPLLQSNCLKEVITSPLLKEMKTSINSSLTTPPHLLDSIIDYVQHIAFDVKLPFPVMTGRPEMANKLAENFIKNIEIIKEQNEVREMYWLDEPIKLEVRVPVARKITLDAMRFDGTKKLFKFIGDKLGDYIEVIVVQPLLDGKMGIEMREKGWKFANPRKDEVYSVAEEIKKLFDGAKTDLAEKVYIREDMLKVLD